VEAFLADHWGRGAHLQQRTDTAELLTLDDVDHLLTATALRAPAFRLVKAGVTLPSSACTRRARIGSRTVTDLIDAGRVADHFADGATIVLQGLHRYWPPVTRFCHALETRLTHPVQANAYLTPPVAQGLAVHADAHDVFAVQTHGSKQWVVYEGDQHPAADGAGGTPTLDVALTEGDVLYLPTGVHHAARTVDAPSLHLTLGVRAVTWADVLRGVLDDVAQDPALDEALPAGFAAEPGALAAEAASRLADLAHRVRDSDAAGAVARTATRFWAGRQPDLRGQVRQVLGLDRIDDAAPVRPRPGVAPAVTVEAGEVRVALADRCLRLPARVEPALRRCLAGAVRTPADLADLLDQAGRRTLVRRLVREGLLEVVDG
jgi:mannose-6-phosphate isomerase-like protein (cupin superfamily)